MSFTKLRRRREFLRVQTGGRRFKGRLMILLIAPGDPEEARVGMTVSRRVGKAVVRNRVRRRFREIVRTHPELLVERFDHVIIAFSNAADASYRALEDELTWLLERALRSENSSESGSSSSSH